MLLVLNLMYYFMYNFTMVIIPMSIEEALALSSHNKRAWNIDEDEEYDIMMKWCDRDV